MPGLGGVTALNVIRRLHPTTRCWFVTGDYTAHSPQELRELGADGVLYKPFRMDDIRALLPPRPAS
jgi:DNA-binding NarL/FixJ family response regulator